MNLRSLILPGLACITLPAQSASLTGIADDSRPGDDFFEEQMAAFADAHDLDARIRLVEFERSNKKYLKSPNTPKTKKPKEGADALGVQINFQSGWLADTFGFDASVFTVGDLHSPHKKTRDLLIETESGHRTGFSKLAQAYVKARIPSEDKNKPLLMFKGGRERIYTGLIAGSGSRAIPSSWRGVDIKGSYEGFSYGLAWVDQISLRNSSNFEKLKSFKKKGSKEGTNLGFSKNGTFDKHDAETIDSVWGAELGYEIMGLSLKYRDSHAKDFLDTYNLDASYKFTVTPEIDLTLNGKYYKEKENGKLWIGSVWGDPAFNKSADIKHFNIAADIGDLMLMVGYTTTTASYKDSAGNKRMGTYYYDFGMNTHGGFDIPTSMLIGDFFYDNEKAWVMGAGYNFNKLIPGLSVEVYHTRGDNFKDGKHSEKLKENETDLDLTYKFQSEMLAGLSFRFRYGMYRPSGRQANADNTGLGGDFSNGKNEHRIYLDYRLKVF
ncbi:OprD family outer membrane porin [Endozoicomonadaceae bacterium StTr2]